MTVGNGGILSPVVDTPLFPSTGSPSGNVYISSVDSETMFSPRSHEGRTQGIRN